MRYLSGVVFVRLGSTGTRARSLFIVMKASDLNNNNKAFNPKPIGVSDLNNAFHPKSIGVSDLNKAFS
jgi:hypothetical protein